MRKGKRAINHPGAQPRRQALALDRARLQQHVGLPERGGTPRNTRTAPGPPSPPPPGPAALSLTELATLGHPAVLPHLQLRHVRDVQEAEKRRGRAGPCCGGADGTRPGAGGAEAGPGGSGRAGLSLGRSLSLSLSLSLSPPRRLGAGGVPAEQAASPGSGQPALTSPCRPKRRLRLQ